MPTASHRWTTPLAYTLIAMGVVSLVLSVWLTTRWAHQPRALIPHGANAVAIDATPSSTKPAATAIASYQVAPTLPKFIAIPAIGVGTTRVIALGLEQGGQIATPNNIFDTGWYNASAKPGQAGAMFIYGHVSSLVAKGIFYDLKDLKIGQDIMITRGDNYHYTYQVAAIKVYPAASVDMTAVLSPINPSKPGLNLMTCTGQIVQSTGAYTERLVVFTSLVAN